MRTGAAFSARCKLASLTSAGSSLRFSGYTPLPPSSINPSRISVSFIPSPSASNPKPLRLLTQGEPEPHIDETRASEILSEEDLIVEVDLGDGQDEAKVWTCDFSHVKPIRPNHTFLADRTIQEYVTINGSVSVPALSVRGRD